MTKDEKLDKFLKKIGIELLPFQKEFIKKITDEDKIYMCYHKLDEWRELCAWIESLPYSELITGPDLSRIPICDEIMEEAKERVKMDTYAVTPRNKE